MVGSALHGHTLAGSFLVAGGLVLGQGRPALNGGVRVEGGALVEGSYPGLCHRFALFN